MARNQKKKKFSSLEIKARDVYESAIVIFEIEFRENENERICIMFTIAIDFHKLLVKPVNKMKDEQTYGTSTQLQ